MANLRTDPQVLRMARELGLKSRGDPVAALKEYALDKVKGFVEGFDVASLERFRSLVANRLSVSVEFIHSDVDVGRVADEFAGYHVALRSVLSDEFIRGRTEGVLLRHPAPHPGEHRYLAVVDAREERTWRAYFTAWHELAHLLVDPPQLSFKFRATPSREQIEKDPVESVVDIIAGTLGFYPPIFLPALETSVAQEGQFNFRAVEKARAAVAPDASFISAMYAALAHTRAPITFLSVEPGFKREELRKMRSPQMGLFPATNAGLPQPKLRAQNVMSGGSDNPIRIYKNMRVPDTSVLRRVFETGADGETLEAVEDQSQWETSRGGPLEPLPIRVIATRRGPHVLGLIQPLGEI